MAEQINFTKKLGNLHGEVMKKLQKGIDQSRANQLGKWLTDLFYGDEHKKGKVEAQQIIQKVNEQMKNRIDEITDLKTLPDKTNTESELIKVARKKFESFSHKEKIMWDTIKDRRNRIAITLQQLHLKKNIRALEKEQEKIYNDLKECYQELNKLFNYKTSKDEKWLVLEDGSNLKEKIQRIDDLYKQTSESISLGEKDIGDIFEYALGFLSLETQKSIDNTVQRGIEQIVQGSNKVKENVKNVKMSLLNTDNGVLKEGTTTRLYEIAPGFSIEIQKDFTPNKSRSQKTDVLLNLSGDDDNKDLPELKVSAKNWADTGDFGSTSLAYAIVRSLGEGNDVLTDTTSIIPKILKTLGMNKKQNIKAVHNLVKYSIAIDIIMGYSQAEGAADTIILNRRQQSKIEVISVQNLMNNLHTNILNFKPNGYDEDMIEEYLHKIFGLEKKKLKEILLNSNHDQSKIELALRYLQSIEVSVSYSNIQNYIHQNLT